MKKKKRRKENEKLSFRSGPQYSRNKQLFMEIYIYYISKNNREKYSLENILLTFDNGCASHGQ